MHAPYLICTLALIEHAQYQWSIIKTDVERFTASFITVGVVFQQFGWHLIPRPLAYDGRKPLQTALPLAPQVPRLEHAATISACNGLPSMPLFNRYVGDGALM